jgi:hypothetical protein
MIRAFIIIRLKQILRAIKGLGLIRIIFLIGLSGFFVFGLFKETAETPNSIYATGLYLIIITLIQLKRPDKRFSQIHFSNYKRIFFVEYLLLMIPWFICLTYHNQWIPVISILVLTLLVVNIDFKTRQRSLNTSIQRLIPSDCFEWKCGLRKSLFFIVPMWLIGLGTSFFIGSVPIAIFILGILPWSFYEKGEPIQMILAYERGSKGFLMHKIKLQLTLFSIISIPLIIAFLLFHPDLWYVPIAEFFLFATSHIYVILTKYAFYQPNNKSNGAQAFGAIGAMGMIIPVLIPVIWLLSIRFYFKSKENLNFYLNDYN